MGSLLLGKPQNFFRLFKQNSQTPIIRDLSYNKLAGGARKSLDRTMFLCSAVSFLPVLSSAPSWTRTFSTDILYRGEHMKNKSRVKYLKGSVCLLFLLQCLTAYGSATPAYFPLQITIPAPDSPHAQQYLGLKNMEPFLLSSINSKIVIVEFFNALCPHCHANAPIVNKLYRATQDDAGLRDVKIIGIAVGSEKPEVEAYRKNFKVPFPLFVDESFAISAAMGGMDTPTTLIVAADTGKVYASHVGVIKDFDGLLKELRAIHKKL